MRKILTSIIIVLLLIGGHGCAAMPAVGWVIITYANHALTGYEIVTTLNDVRKHFSAPKGGYLHTTHKGNIAEELAAETHKAEGKTRLKSHYGSGHGPDNVYIDGQKNVYIEEVKVNTSGYKKSQVSDEQIRKWIKKMENSNDPELKETAKLLEKAMNNGKLTRIYTRVNTGGTITRTIVDKFGDKITKLPPVQATEQMVKIAFERCSPSRAISISSKLYNGAKTVGSAMGKIAIKVLL